jgi:hypothetical protein
MPSTWYPVVVAMSDEGQHEALFLSLATGAGQTCLARVVTPAFSTRKTILWAV